jgi:hypothetical protein
MARIVAPGVMPVPRGNNYGVIIVVIGHVVGNLLGESATTHHTEGATLAKIILNINNQ